MQDNSSCPEVRRDRTKLDRETITRCRDVSMPRRRHVITRGSLVKRQARDGPLMS